MSATSFLSLHNVKSYTIESCEKINSPELGRYEVTHIHIIQEVHGHEVSTFLSLFSTVEPFAGETQ